MRYAGDAGVVNGGEGIADQALELERAALALVVELVVRPWTRPCLGDKVLSLIADKDWMPDKDKPIADKPSSRQGDPPPPPP